MVARAAQWYGIDYEVMWKRPQLDVERAIIARMFEDQRALNNMAAMFGKAR